MSAAGSAHAFADLFRQLWDAFYFNFWALSAEVYVDLQTLAPLQQAARASRACGSVHGGATNLSLAVKSNHSKLSTAG